MTVAVTIASIAFTGFVVELGVPATSPIAELGPHNSASIEVLLLPRRTHLIECQETLDRRCTWEELR